MLGAIIGDVVGSVYEFDNIRTKQFPLLSEKSKFTDDTVLTVAVMDWILHENNKNQETAQIYLRKWGQKYPYSGFGCRFFDWLNSKTPKPYDSYGNGCAMRISALGWISDDIEAVKSLSDTVTGVTHNHPEGLKGAFVVAQLISMARQCKSKIEMQMFARQYYDLDFDYEELRRTYKFNEKAQTTIPQAIYCFLASNNFIDCLRTSVSIGGDTDTLCAISCAIAEAYYNYIPEELIDGVRNKLPDEMLIIIDEFKKKYGGN